MRQLLVRLGGGRGHRAFTGTPEQVADTIQHWFESGAADGPNPCGLDDILGSRGARAAQALLRATAP